MTSGFCKTPMIFQMEATECGAASFAMICAYWGKHVPLEQMRIETGVSRDGCSGADIMRAAKRMGMKCRARRMSVDTLWEAPLTGPIMLFWEQNHFVVLEGFERGLARVNDPEIGRCKLGYDEFAAGYAGVAMGFEPTDDFQPAPKEERAIPLLRQRLSQMPAEIAQLVVVGLLFAIPGIAIALLAGAFIDGFMGANPPSGAEELPAFLVLLFAAVALQLALGAFHAFATAKVRYRFAKLSAHEFLQHLMRLPLAFFEMRFPGDVLARIRRNDAISSFLVGDALEAVLRLLESLVCLVVLVVLCPPLAAVGCAVAAGGVLAVWLAARATGDTAQKLSQEKSRLLGTLCIGVDAIETLQVAGAQKQYAEQVLELEEQVSALEQRSATTQAMVQALPTAVGLLCQAVLLLVGGLIVVSGGLSWGTFFACIVLFASFIQPLGFLARIMRRISQIRVDIEQVDDAFQCPEDAWLALREEPSAVMGRLSGAVDVRNASFSYAAFSPVVVQNVSLSLRPGTMLALVGSSGSGKSTLAKLLAGLYHPREGRIEYDGKDITSIPPDAFRASVAVVGQESALFAGTVRENLTLWNPAVLDGDIERAVRDACIDEAIARMPGGFEHHVAPGGANLSGGQRQGLEIARALATNPAILVLDEATSALDAETERRILDNLRKRGCTCIVVTHRPEAMRACDEVAVMSAGRMVERGSAEDLERAGGVFSQFVAAERGRA